MSITKIQDIIQPEVFTDYVIQRTAELSEILNSGIAERTAEFDALASTPNRIINMPYWNDLTGEAEVMDDVGEVTPGKISAGADLARKQGWVKSFGVNALAAYLSGDDPAGAIGELFAEYWARQYQQILLSVLDGVFEAEGMGEKVHDITDESGDAALISGSSVLDALQLMGDAKGQLTGLMMNSAVETYLAKNDLLKGVIESEGRAEIPTFLGKRVIVDDAMPFDTQTGAGVVYLFGQGAIAWGDGSSPDILATETVRKGLSLAGEDILVNRRLSILHPRGVKWLEPSSGIGAFPTLEHLEDGDNWERVYEPKAVRIVKFMFKVE